MLSHTNGDLCTYSHSMPQRYPKYMYDQSPEAFADCHILGSGVPYTENYPSVLLIFPVAHRHDQGAQPTFRSQGHSPSSETTLLQFKADISDT